MPAIHSITIPATRSYKLLELAGGSFAGDFSVVESLSSLVCMATRRVYKLLELAGGSFAGDFSVVESLSSLVCMATRRVTQFVINFNNNNKTVSTMEVNTRQK